MDDIVDNRPNPSFKVIESIDELESGHINWIESYRKKGCDINQLEDLINRRHVWVYRNAFEKRSFEPYIMIELRHFYFIASPLDVMMGYLTDIHVLEIEDYRSLKDLGVDEIALCLLRIESHTGDVMLDPDEDDEDVYDRPLYHINILARDPIALFCTDRWK